MPADPRWVFPSEGKGFHNCNDEKGPNLDCSGYGPAFDRCRENSLGEFWVDNGEYFSRVNFCPYCGTPAPTKQ